MRYPGGKGGDGVFQRIISLMPPHDVYIEPFLGGAAVMLAKMPAKINIGIERDRATLEMVVPAARAIFGDAYRRDSPATFARSLTPSDTAIPPAGSLDPALLQAPPIDTFSDGRRRFEFHEANAIHFLARLAAPPPRTLIYCDPPYVMESRRQSTRAIYKHEMTNADHVEFLQAVVSLKCFVMVSGYDSKLYRGFLKDWHVTQFQAMTRGGHMATETLWMNYPPPVELHDYRYLGEGFRERERIKRKKLRWAARLVRMPMLERQALLAAISEAFPA